MMVFGKRLSEYVRFQRVILGLIVVVGLARLLLSLAGVSNDVVRFFSMTVLAIAGVFYYGIRVPITGFGSYRHLLPLLVIQSVVSNLIVIAGILISRFSHRPNVFTAPEFGGVMRTRWHILGHVGGGMIVFSLVLWAVASLVMWVTKRVSGKGRVQPATA
jgi:hypothetical protein